MKQISNFTKQQKIRWYVFYIFTQVIDHQQKLCGIVIHRWHAPIVGKTWFIQKSSWVRTKWGEIISQEALWFFCTNTSRNTSPLFILLSLNEYSDEERRFMYQNRPSKSHQGSKYIYNPSSVVYVPELIRALPDSILHQTFVMTSSKFHEYLIKLIKVFGQNRCTVCSVQRLESTEKEAWISKLRIQIETSVLQKYFTPLWVRTSLPYSMYAHYM